MELNRNVLCGYNWHFGPENHSVTSRHFRFNPDGSISGYEHFNEAFWAITDQRLKIFNANRELTWIFEHLPSELEVLFIGVYQPDPSHPTRQILSRPAQAPKIFRVANLAEIASHLGEDRVRCVENGAATRYVSKSCLNDLKLRKTHDIPADQRNINDLLELPGHQVWCLKDAVVFTRHGLVLVDDFLVSESTNQFPFHLYENLLFDGETLSVYEEGASASISVAYHLTNGNLENYFHYLVETIAKLSLQFFMNINSQSGVHVILPTLKETYQLQILELVISDLANFNPMTLSAQEKVRCDNLYYAHLYPAGSLYPNEVILSFSKMLKAAWKKHPFNSGTFESNRKIYISRRDSTNRILENERLVEEALKGRGFEIFTLTELTVAEQISLFQSAETIVAPHGAGLTNIIFCNEGTKILEIHMEGNTNWVYRRLADTLGLKYQFVLGQVSKNEAESVDARNYCIHAADLMHSLDSLE
ncbi:MULTISPECIES: DUF563 domain-containing protein [unclassified Acidocella]|uniref:glycosyltransferase family 61 protein n=1 Tax=unclassified Acidocella TaxID=2648610 RepID=UPI00034BDC7E|nr:MULTISPECIES: glycosyltransferase family 61 protein [unclassified Acidocella]WBO60058.1 glycosyltransferase family 61 protein [Acidocella sp. MX-AZ03]